jgi:hypothetical protein
MSRVVSIIDSVISWFLESRPSDGLSALRSSNIQTQKVPLRPDDTLSSEPPTEQTHRTVIRSVRFTPEEWATVKERAATVGLSPSRFLRQVALGTPFGRRVNAEAVIALNRAGVNLNNLVRRANRNGQPLIGGEVTGVLEELRETLRGLL